MFCTCDFVDVDEHHLVMRVHSDWCPEHGSLDAETEDELDLIREREWL